MSTASSVLSLFGFASVLFGVTAERCNLASVQAVPPLGGRVNGVAFSPTAGTYFAATATGGVWRTRDGGQTWTPLSDRWLDLHTSSVVVDPRNPNVVYVGTGDYDSGVSSFGIGIMKSVDGGDTWKQYGTQIVGGIRSIVIDPASSNIVHATSGRSTLGEGWVWRSTDAGLTWNIAFTPSGDWCELAYGMSGELYALGEAEGGRLFRSTDRGVNWARRSLPVSAVMQNSIDIATGTNPAFPNSLFLISGTDRMLYFSIDKGDTWEDDATLVFPHHIDLDDSGGIEDNEFGSNWWESAHSRHITCDFSGNVWVGLYDLLGTSDLNNWGSFNRNDNSVRGTVHANNHCMAVNPSNPLELLIGTDGGVYRLQFDTGTNNWGVRNLNKTIGVAQLNRSAHHPTDPNIALASSLGSGTPILQGDLGNWVSFPSLDGGQPAISPSSPSVQVLQDRWLEMFITTNNWKDFKLIANSESELFAGEQIPYHGAVSFSYGTVVTGAQSLWAFVGGESVWERLTPNLCTGTGTISAITAIGDDRSTFGHYAASTAGDLWISYVDPDTKIEVLRRINTGSPALPVRAISSVSINPANRFDIVVSLHGTGAGHVWRCADTTAVTPVWKNISGNPANQTGLPDVPARTVVIDPSDPANVIYAGTDLGVFGTRDGGKTWENAGGPWGLPNVPVTDLHITPGTGYMTAATWGRGMWRVYVGTHTISGRVTADGADLAGVMVEARQGTVIRKTTTTAADGTYSLEGLERGQYTIRPSLGSSTFNPAEQVKSVIDVDLPGVDFVATIRHSVAGLIQKADGSPLGGVKITAGKNSVTSTPQGTYSFDALPRGNYTIIPTLAGYTFEPPSQQITVADTDQSVPTFRTGVPLAPANLTARMIEPTRVRIEWENVSKDETGYKLAAKRNDGSFFDQTGLTLGPNATAAEIYNLRPGTTYTFQVRSYNSVGDCPNPPQAAVTVPGTPPLAPTNLKAKALKKKKIKLTWSDNSRDETGFRVEVQIGGKGPFKEMAQTVKAGKKKKGSATLGGFIEGTVYAFRVRAIGTGGDSAPSNSASATAKK